MAGRSIWPFICTWLLLVVKVIAEPLHHWCTSGTPPCLAMPSKQWHIKRRRSHWGQRIVPTPRVQYVLQIDMKYSTCCADLHLPVDFHSPGNAYLICRCNIWLCGNRQNVCVTARADSKAVVMDTTDQWIDSIYPVITWPCELLQC